VWLNISFIFENVGAGDVQGSPAAQEAAKLAMSQATEGVIPPKQISIVRVVLLASRRFLREENTNMGNNEFLWRQRNKETHRQLGTVYSELTFQLLGRLEEIVKIEEMWLNNTATQTYVNWIKRTVTKNVREDAYTSNLKTAGAAAGVNVFMFAKVSILPTFSEPVTVYASTYAPSFLPTGAPSAAPTWGETMHHTCRNVIPCQIV
jgi:hypothetical protein